MYKKLFGKINGQKVYSYTLKNSCGMSLSVSNYGCVIQSLCVSDRSGHIRDVVLGFDGLKDYTRQKYYIGTVIGRCANRIKGAVFTLNGREYQLSRNEGENHLHGGHRGFHDRVWETEFEGKDRIIFRYISPDGEEGYPGSMEVRIGYELTADNTVIVQYRAACDADTIVNLTNHSYFNLAGHDHHSIEDHELQVFADAYTQIDESCTPTGVIAPVAGTPLDLREPTRIGERLNIAHDQIRYGSGYNHNYVLNKSRKNLSAAAILSAPSVGLRMKVYTTMPGLQLYTGNYLKGDIKGKDGAIYKKFAGVCLETQGFPDAVHHAHFPSVICKKDDVYTSKTVLAFETF